jgi:hypothetical protein
MSSIVISGDTSGSVTIAAPAVAGTNTITLPAGTGTMTVAGVNSNIVSGTAQATTSGTSKDFTSIPSWVKRITIMLNGVSLSGVAYIRFQLGTGGTPTTSGYVSYSGVIITSTVNVVNATAGFDIFGATATYADSGALVFTNLSGNIWTVQGNYVNTTTASYVGMISGIVTLSGALDMVRITTSNGTDTFDAGSVNILYE